MNFIGIDFGTSNSLAALLENGQVKFVQFPDNNISNPTILYFPPKSKLQYIGNDAVYRHLFDIEDGKFGRLMQSIKTLLPDTSFDRTFVLGHGDLDAAAIAAKFLAPLKQLAEAQFSRSFDGVVLGRPVQFPEIALLRLEQAAKTTGFKEVVFWLEPVAAAMAYEITVAKDELVCVVDLGGGTSDICVVGVSQLRS